MIPAKACLAARPRPVRPLERAIERRDAGDLAASLHILQVLVARRMRQQGRKGFDTQCTPKPRA